MSDHSASITLREWRTVSPEDCDQLSGRYFDDSDSTRRTIKLLNKSRMLRLTELRNGIEITSFSHVGRIRVGDLSITVLPKIETNSLVRLLRYAFGFRRLDLIAESSQFVEQCGFEDLLISQLNAEAQEIISRGLHRNYIRKNDQLSSPQGRIDINQLALSGGLLTATLPCQHFPRVSDFLLNQILAAGLRMAGSLATRLELRRDANRLAGILDDDVSRVQLNASVLDQAGRQLTRLTTSYTAAISIIRLLFEAQGVVLDRSQVAVKLPGFLFNMNAFFQSLMSRFLKHNLPDFTLREEQGLKDMMRYNALFNPRQRRSPTPRPDYALLSKGRLHSLLDAKYRDLWEKPLPREMLYQLVVYAISHRETLQSSILYPTNVSSAKEARIDITDPIFGKHLGQVRLRPVSLERIDELVSTNSASARREREKYALQLALGNV